MTPASSRAGISAGAPVSVPLGASTSALYFDHNATTPLDPDVFALMVPYFLERFGNPSSVTNAHGVEAAAGLERARALVASSIGARSEEIIFTGSCTEANNLAILGAAEAELARSRDPKRHLVTTQIEHPAVLEAFRALQARGFEVTYLPVSPTALVDVQALEEAIRPETLLVSVMGANNEVGTIQPLSEIGAVCAARGVLFHSDCAQLAAYGEIDVQESQLHLVSLSGHKVYGPKGVGALYVRSRRPRVALRPIVHGGGQERGLRSGTVAVPLAVGLGAALEKARSVRVAESTRVTALRAQLLAGLQAAAPELVVNGERERRLPNNLSVSIPGIEPYALLHALAGRLSFSASSACATQDVKTSHVLLAMYGEDWRARYAVRFGLGRSTSEAHVEQAVSLMTTELGRLGSLAC